MRRISMKQIKSKAELNGWKPLTEKEWCFGIRPEKDFYYSAGQYGINGLVFFANDDNVYYVIGRTSMLFKVMR